MSNPEIPATKLERIRSLLAKAEATEYEPERDTFMNAAAALMAKYGIEQAHLDASDPGRRTRPIRRDVTLTQGAWGRQRADLAWSIAEAMRCRALIFTGVRNGGAYRLAIVGYESDVERAEMMFTSVLLQMTGELIRLGTPLGEDVRTYRKAWLVGYRVRVAERIRAMEAREEDSAEGVATGTTLMLRDRSLRVDDMFSEEFKIIRKGRKQQVSRSGFDHGQAAGSRANLGGTGLENRRRSLPR